jgi:large subunit ribosomal protein L20
VRFCEPHTEAARGAHNRKTRTGESACATESSFCFLLRQAERNPPRWACRPAVRSKQKEGRANARDSFAKREIFAELLNTPWRRFAFRLCAGSRARGLASMLRIALRLRNGENKMARVKRGTKRRARRKKYLKRTKGFFLTKSKLYQSAQEAVNRAERYSYRDRRARKRQFRRLWIQRIGAAARNAGISYSQLMHGLKAAGVEIDRKMLSDIAVKDAAGFTLLVEQAKASLGAKAKA